MKTWIQRNNCPADLMESGKIIATFYPDVDGKGDVIMSSISKAHDRAKLASNAPLMKELLMDFVSDYPNITQATVDMAKALLKLSEPNT